jgi:hypothetical protein
MNWVWLLLQNGSESITPTQGRRVERGSVSNYKRDNNGKFASKNNKKQRQSEDTDFDENAQAKNERFSNSSHPQS